MHLGTRRQVIVLAAIALIAGLGLCLFDTDDAAAEGACMSALETTSGPSLKMLLPLSGRLPLGSVTAYSVYPPDLPAPPPKA